MGEKVNVVDQKITPENKELIQKCLKEHFVFWALSPEELEIITNALFYCEVRDAQYVFM